MLFSSWLPECKQAHVLPKGPHLEAQVRDDGGEAIGPQKGHHQLL